MNKGRNIKISKKLIGNKNAEKWDLETSIKFFEKAIEMTSYKVDYTVLGKKLKGFEYDFIGEIAAELNTFKEIFSHLTKRFPELKEYKDLLITNLERNCYYNTKRGIIREGTGIVNLKSHHGWTDRQQTNIGGELKTKSQIIVIDKEEADKINNIIDSLNNE